MAIKLPTKVTKFAKSYLRAVAASAITLALAMASDLDPKVAIVVGAFAGPLAQWADKTEKEFGRGSK